MTLQKHSVKWSAPKACNLGASSASCRASLSHRRLMSGRWTSAMALIMALMFTGPPLLVGRGHIVGVKKQRTAAARVIFILSLLILAATFAHAQSVVLQLPPEDRQIITAQLGPGVVGQALPSKPIDEVSIYFPLQDAASTYQVIAGPNAGRTQTLGLTRVRRPKGKSAWRFQLSPTLAGFISQTSTGDLIMPTISDMGEGVVVITTPANPFVLKGMKPGESRSYLQHVMVNSLDDPTDQEYSGSLNGTYTYLGSYQVRVPAGTYQAILFRLRCHGKVGPADTQDTAYYLFAPRKAVIAMISQESATAFWLIHIDTTSGKVLRN
jgi:hypothetical protein